MISYKTLPGGGTTDYAVDIYYSAIKEGKYTCFIDRGTAMDMMYMPDAIEAIVQLMNADPKNLVHLHHTLYNSSHTKARLILKWTMQLIQCDNRSQTLGQIH